MHPFGCAFKCDCALIQYDYKHLFLISLRYNFIGTNTYIFFIFLLHYHLFTPHPKFNVLYSIKVSDMVGMFWEGVLWDG